MRSKLLAAVILVISATIGLSILESSASAVRLVSWTNTSGSCCWSSTCICTPYGSIPTTETSRTAAATDQAYNAIFGGGKFWYGSCYFITDECDGQPQFDFFYELCMDGTWRGLFPTCANTAGAGTWDVVVSMPSVSVLGAPASWQYMDAQATVSCSQPLGSCDAGTHRILVYSSNPGSCPANYNDYPLSSPQAISSHSWVCAAAKDTAGDAGFSNPVEFLVDKTPPAGTIAINNGALYTTSSSVTLYLTYSDTGGSGVQGCRYSNDGVFDTEPWESCTATKSWTLTPGVGSKTVYYQIIDNAGNTYQTSDSIFVISSSDSCNTASNGFYCCVRNGACQGSEIDVLHMSARMNAHAEMFSQSNYPYRVCCGGVIGLGRDCSGAAPYDTAVRLLSATNSHAAIDTFLTYTNQACLSVNQGQVECSYADSPLTCASLGADYTCVATMYADSNAHISDCDGIADYGKEVCCKAKSPCRLTSVTITADCGGGSSSNCETGERIYMSAQTTGDCSTARLFQIDARSSDSTCDIQFYAPPGNMQGISNSSNLIIGGGYVNGAWTIPSIPAACIGKTVSAGWSVLYNETAPSSGKNISQFLAATGQFTFRSELSPTCSITSIAESPDSAYSYSSGSTVWYNTNSPSGGSFITNADANAYGACTPVQKVTFPLTVSTGGEDATSPYALTYTWDSSDTFSGLATASVQDSCLQTGTCTFNVIRDVTPPSGGTISYPNGYYTAASVSVAFSDGTDSQSGVNASSAFLERQEAALSGGACGAFGSWGRTGTYDPSSPYIDSTVQNGRCYRYRYRVSDYVSNERIYTSSNTTMIDTSGPTVSVSHSPPSPRTYDTVTFTAAASDAESGLNQISIYVDGSLARTCASGVSPCAYTGGPYSEGSHTYYAAANDTAGNLGRDPPSGSKTFTVTGCHVTASISLDDLNSNSLADIGEKIRMTGQITGDCSTTRLFQIDGRSADGSCVIQFYPPVGYLSGISDNSTLTIGGGYVNGTWNFSYVPLSCLGKIVYATFAALYNETVPSEAKRISPASAASGSFRFIGGTLPTCTVSIQEYSPYASVSGTTLWYNSVSGGSFNVTANANAYDGCFAQRVNFPATVSLGGNDFSSPYNWTYSWSPAQASSGSATVTVYDTCSQQGTCQFEFRNDTAVPTVSINPLSEWTSTSSFSVSWSGSDGSGSGISGYNLQYNSTWTNGTGISGWSDWLSQTPLTSGTFSLGQNNFTYYFKARATDNVGNTGPYSAERSTSVDTEAPNIFSAPNDDRANGAVRISSSAWDGVSGIFNHNISCIVTNPSSTIFMQCLPADPFGGISSCQTPQIPYTEETDINCNMAVEDWAGNMNYTNIFFTMSADHPLVELGDHRIFITIGETYHVRVMIRNIKPVPDMVNVSITGTYPEGLAGFLESSPIIWLSPDRRNITVSLNPYEQKTAYIEILSTDVDDYTLNLTAGSKANPLLDDSDSMRITIGFPAAFPAIEIFSAAAILSLSGLAYFRYLRKPKQNIKK